MLARSRTLPISISAVFVSRPLQDAVSEALLEVSRAREVILSSGIVQRLVLPLQDRPAPLLETLSLSQAVLYCAMPDDLFAGETPKLTALTMKRTELRWSSALLRPALRHLEVWDVQKESLPSMNQVLDVLETMHDLQTLILVRALPEGHDIDGVQVRLGGFAFEDADRVVTLPALRKLHLGGQMSQCTTLIGHLSIPPNSQVELECTPSPDFPDAPPPVAILEAVLASHFSRRDQYRHLPVPTFQGLSLGISSSNLVYFRADTATTPEGNGHTFSVTYQAASDSASISHAKVLLSSLCRAVLLKGVRSLEVEGAAFREGGSWQNSFGSMKDVERLFVTGVAADGFLHSLASISPTSIATEDPSTDSVLDPSRLEDETILGLLAQLKEVELIEVDFRTGVTTRLCEGLRTMQSASNLERPVLKSCEISRPDVDGLRRVGLEIDLHVL